MDSSDKPRLLGKITYRHKCKQSQNVVNSLNKDDAKLFQEFTYLTLLSWVKKTDSIFHA